jgi:hypothetical protein
MRPEELLPPEVLMKASLSGNEYGWRVYEIPSVIEAARKSNLLNVGGQLQFRVSDGTCECYWIDIDTYKTVLETLPWSERVELSAAEALKAYALLSQTKDFLAEGRNNFDHLAEFEKAEAHYPKLCGLFGMLKPVARGILRPEQERARSVPSVREHARRTQDAKDPRPMPRKIL